MATLRFGWIRQDIAGHEPAYLVLDLTPAEAGQVGVLQWGHQSAVIIDPEPVDEHGLGHFLLNVDDLLVPTLDQIAHKIEIVWESQELVDWYCRFRLQHP